MGRWIQRCKYGNHSWGSPRRLRESVGKQYPLFGKFVNIWSRVTIITVTAKVVWTAGINRKKQYIGHGFLCFRTTFQNKEKHQKRSEERRVAKECRSRW